MERNIFSFFVSHQLSFFYVLFCGIFIYWELCRLSIGLTYALPTKSGLFGLYLWFRRIGLLVVGYLHTRNCSPNNN